MDVPRVTGAAQRRKQRRIRSWWRHEQASVAAAVATALHHSSQRGGGVVRRPTGTEDSGNRKEEVHEMYGALRRQNRPPPGRRPEPLEEVSEPQAGIGRTRESATSWFSTPWCRRWLNSWGKFRCLRSQWSTSHPRPLCPKLPRRE